MILIGGDPGIGKSTLLLQAFAAVSQKGLTCLYVSGEESQRQIKMRAERLGIEAPNLLILSETSLERILEHVKKIKPGLLVIDSIQTIFSSAIPSAPGSIAQVREASGAIIVLAKKTGLTTFLIGHVTKDGAIAGPRLLEHMVDTVLYFEGERGHSFRILRAVKNRFGSTNEIGVFEMKEAGLKEVTNPSEIFLMERPLQVPGSAVVCSMEGTRPILVELQALVSRSFLGGAATHDHRRRSQSRRTAGRRIGEKMGAKLFDQDIFVNVAGGVHVDEPAVDLGIVAAIASSSREKVLDPRTVFFGEVGLAGEIRGISQAEARSQRSRQARLRALHPAGEQQRSTEAHQASEARRRRLAQRVLEAFVSEEPIRPFLISKWTYSLTAVGSSCPRKRASRFYSRLVLGLPRARQ